MILRNCTIPGCPGLISKWRHEIDLFPTIAAAVGAPEIVPQDRLIDGVNQLPFLEGKQSHSNRENVIFLAREGHVMAVKWHNWKLWYHFSTEMPDPHPDDLVRLFDPDFSGTWSTTVFSAAPPTGQAPPHLCLHLEVAGAIAFPFCKTVYTRGYR